MCRYDRKLPKAEDVADPVNSPKHYHVGGLECIDAIEQLGLGFHVGNVFKYLWRAGRKDKSKTLEDMKKAAWYLARAINNLEKELNVTSKK